MNMQVAQCSQCGGKLEPSNGKDVATCAYCGHSVVLREVIKVQMQGDVGSLMALAESALDAENGQKALEYYTEALEYDGTNSEAWFGRAQAVALTSFSNDLQIRKQSAISAKR